VDGLSAANPNKLKNSATITYRARSRYAEAGCGIGVTRKAVTHARKILSFKKLAIASRYWGKWPARYTLTRAQLT
jgi:hypothetical protein